MTCGYPLTPPTGKDADRVEVALNDGTLAPKARSRWH